MTRKFAVYIILILVAYNDLNSQSIFQFQNPGFRPEPVFSMNVINGNLILGGAYGFLMNSVNGGQSWSEININTKSEIRMIKSQGAGTGLLYSSDSCLYKTMDGGLSWT
ncbi:MAG: hypothetical protein L0Y76_00785, partial [Ignavibacteria bacterium]|nr:hypothetical protein [Ignavibacteria bacterium]